MPLRPAGPASPAAGEHARVGAESARLGACRLRTALAAALMCATAAAAGRRPGMK